jgi:hypothetical protein
MKTAAPKIDKAVDSKTLNPTMQLLPTLRELYTLEDAATGSADKTVPLIKSVGEHARELINTELAKLSRRLNNLQELASEPVGINDTITVRGIVGDERTELQNMIDYLAQIEKVAQQGRWINRRLGGTGEDWDHIIADCNAASDDAQQLLQPR